MNRGLLNVLALISFALLLIWIITTAPLTDHFPDHDNSGFSTHLYWFGMDTGLHINTFGPTDESVIARLYDHEKAITIALQIIPIWWLRRRKWEIDKRYGNFLAKLPTRANRIAAGKCPSCGYDLRATPNRCPECGQAV